MRERVGGSLGVCVCERELEVVSVLRMCMRERKGDTQSVCTLLRMCCNISSLLRMCCNISSNSPSGAVALKYKKSGNMKCAHIQA